MRHVHYHLACSLDGYIARHDHSVDWLPETGDYGIGDFYADVDTALIGRKSHDFMVKHGQPTMPGITNYVFSRNPSPKEYEGVHWVKEDGVAFVEGLKKQEGKTIWLVGGVDLAKTFFDARVVDEISLTIIPILLGDGVPFFPKTNETRLHLLEERKYEDGVVSLRYACRFA